MPKLTVQDRGTSARECTLDADETVIGRDPGCELVLKSESVSRRHARIVRRDEGFFIQDLHSRNGTWVNGERVESAVRLIDGDRVQLYDVVLKFSDSAIGRARSKPAAPAYSAGDESVNDTLFSGVEIAVEIPAAGDAPSSQQTETVAELDVVHPSAGDALVNPEVKLKAVLEITRNLGTSLDLDQVLPRILESVFHIFPQTERGCILQGKTPGKPLKLAALKEREEHGESPGTLRPLTQSVIRQVLSDGKAILSTDENREAKSGESGASDKEDSVFDFQLRSLMCAPLIGASRQPQGILYIETVDGGHPFDRDDLDVLVSVAILAGQAMHQATRYESRHRAVVEAALDSIISIDHKGRIVAFNSAAEQTFGYSRETAIGRELAELIIPPELRERHRQGIARFLATGQSTILGRRLELPARRANGEEFPAEISVVRIPVDGPPIFTGILRDITERKEAEQTLQSLNATLEQRVRERTRQIELLHDAAVIANEAESVERAFEAAVDRICRYTGWPIGHVYVQSSDDPEVFVDSGIWHVSEFVAEQCEDFIEAGGAARFRLGEGLVGRVIEARRPEWVPDLAHDAGFARSGNLAASELNAALLFPVMLRENVVAVLEFFFSSGVEEDRALLDVMANFGTQLGRVVERRRMQKEVIDSLWGQQRQFGQELHDSLGQELTGTRMMADSLHWKLSERDVPESGVAGELSRLIQNAQQSARRLAKGQFPVEVFAHGLMAALDELAKTAGGQSGVDCRFESDGVVEIHGNDVATHLFRIAQEAVNNAVKHSDAAEIVVSLRADDRLRILTIRDNGRGIPVGPDAPAAGIGMRIMHYRANLVGARLTIEPAPDNGTVVTCIIQQEPSHGDHDHHED